DLRHRRQALIDHTDLDLRRPGGQRGQELRSEIARFLRGGALGAVERPRKPHHDDTRLELASLLDDARDGGAALEGLDRGGDHPVEVAAGEADADIAHVDPEADPSRQPAGLGARPLRHAHAVGAAAIASRTAVSAAGMRAGSPPPPCARSGLPPPRPPIASAAPRSIVPAARPRSRAVALVAMTSAARPPSWPATAIVTGTSSPSRERRSRARVRRSPAAIPSPASCATRRTPATSLADSTSLPASAWSCWPRRAASCFSMSFIRWVRERTRSGSSSAAPTFSSSESWETSACSLAWWRQADSPTSASTRRTPLPIAASPMSCTVPIAPVLSTWVPPQSARDQSPPI